METHNYRSATCAQNKSKVEAQVVEELVHDRYRTVSEVPPIVSALGAIPKKDGRVRLIHDCSRPEGSSLNAFAWHDRFQYMSLQDAVDVMQRGAYLAKVDLSNAYRSVRIHPSNYAATGLKWTFDGENAPTYLVDTRLPFGARRSPEIFNELGQAVRRIMARKGFPSIIVYLDDFLVIGDTQEECRRGLNELMRTLRRLGFSINYNKVAGPSQKLTFLGIMLDTLGMTIQLPDQKLDELQQVLHQAREKQKIKKRDLQSLVGKLSWACQCIQGGRTFIRRLIDPIGQLKSPWHRTRMTKHMREDITWWIEFLDVFNGCTPMIDDRPVLPVWTDACLVAAGAVFGREYVYTPFGNWPGAAGIHINFKEALAVETAAVKWAHKWSNHRVFVYCDNQAAVGILNKGSCRDPFLMQSLRRIFWLSATFNFKIKAIYFPGVENVLADAVSRLHEPRGYERLMAVAGSQAALGLPRGANVVSRDTFLELAARHPSKS